MTKPLEALISSEIADFFAGFVEIHTELGDPNTVEEAQCQLTERVTRIATECEAALIAALEQKDKRISELEVSETQLITERDNAEEALADMYQAATGERPEWSNHFGFADAVEAVEQRLGELEARPVASIDFKENADADFCREWAWDDIKKDLPTENWSISDGAAFYGFYLMGWDARRQFNEQRKAEALKLFRAAGGTVGGE